MADAADKISIAAEDPASEAATRLIAELSTCLAAIYGDFDDDGSGSFAPADVRVARSVFLIARLNGEPVGCGALRPIEADVAEIKRMYVAENARRMGIGQRLMTELEAHAAKFGYRFMRLETGVRQSDAMMLYERCGFYRIALYGEYAGNTLSACYEKRVGA